MPRRIHAPENRHISWFHPPVRIGLGSPRPERSSLAPGPDGSFTGIDPETWAMQLGLMVTRVCRNPVGRVIVESVRKRTTIYPTVGGAQTDPDPFDDMAGVEISQDRVDEAKLNAQTVGERALIYFDVNRPTERRRPTDEEPEAVAESPVAALAHELVHAVNINAGNYRLHRAYNDEGVRRHGAPSQEERFAVLIDNMFRSAAGMWLRTQHESGRLLPPGTRLTSASTGTALSENERRVVSNAHRRVGHLARRLEALTSRQCPYNPFRRRARLGPAARA